MRPEPRALGAAVGRSGRRGRLGSSREYSIHARAIDRPRTAGFSNRRPPSTKACRNTSIKLLLLFLYITLYVVFMYNSLCIKNDLGFIDTLRTRASLLNLSFYILIYNLYKWLIKFYNETKKLSP